MSEIDYGDGWREATDEDKDNPKIQILAFGQWRRRYSSAGTKLSKSAIYRVPIEPSTEPRSGSKYLRELRGLIDGRADVYALIETFGVECPARAHAIKKLLFAGLRGKGDALQDLHEARDAVTRAIELEQERQADENSTTIERLDDET